MPSKHHFCHFSEFKLSKCWILWILFPRLSRVILLKKHGARPPQQVERERERGKHGNSNHGNSNQLEVDGTNLYV